MTEPVRNIIGPVLLWTLHFVAVYALVSAACGPRTLLGPDMLRATAGLATLTAGAGALGFMIAAVRRGRARKGGTEDARSGAAFWASAISLLAILGNLWPVAMMTGCSG